MSKIGLAILVFGVIVPVLAYRLERRVGFGWLVAGSIAAGLAYGALKADNPWVGEGLSKNLSLMLVSALALALYLTLSLGAVNLVAKAIKAISALRA